MKTMRLADHALFLVCALMQHLASVTSELTDPSSVQVGDEICFEGFVMDEFCIERGTLLDVRRKAACAIVETIHDISYHAACGQLHSQTLSFSTKFYRTPTLSRSKALNSTRCTGAYSSSQLSSKNAFGGCVNVWLGHWYVVQHEK
jgi:hypothetical protein